MSWDHDALWSKAKVQIDRALDESRDSDGFAFWTALSLELLARAALSKVSPLLLADPAKDDLTSILYALGKQVGKGRPKSRNASSVFQLCHRLVPDFGEDELKISMVLSDVRNEELHSGTRVLAGPQAANWLTSFYRAADALCRFQSRSLEDFLGFDEGAAARAMLDADTKAVGQRVKSAISRCRHDFEQKPEAERQRLGRESLMVASGMVTRGGHRVVCPACQSQTWLRGAEYAPKNPTLENDEIVIRTTMLPSSMRCQACGLTLDGHAEMAEAGLGAQYTRTHRVSPLEYFANAMDGPDYDNE